MEKASYDRSRRNTVFDDDVFRRPMVRVSNKVLTSDSYAGNIAHAELGDPYPQRAECHEQYDGYGKR